MNPRRSLSVPAISGREKTSNLSQWTPQERLPFQPVFSLRYYNYSSRSYWIVESKFASKRNLQVSYGFVLTLQTRLPVKLSTNIVSLTLIPVKRGVLSSEPVNLTFFHFHQSVEYQRLMVIKNNPTLNLHCNIQHLSLLMIYYKTFLLPYYIFNGD